MAVPSVNATVLFTLVVKTGILIVTLLSKA